MEALRVQHAGHGGRAALLTRAESPVGGTSRTRAFDGGAHVDRLARQCAPFTEAAVRPEASEPAEPAEHIELSASDSARPALSAHPSVGLAEAVALVHAAAAAAPDELAMADYVEAADYAGLAEELSRTVDYLQILAAGAVDRTRTRAIAAAATARSGRSGRSWVTGWDNGTETLNETDASWPATTATATSTATAAEGTALGISTPVPASPADDGCRNTEEFLRTRLRIGITEARRRLRLAHDVLPATTLTGDRTPPAREHLAAGLTPGGLLESLESAPADSPIAAEAPAVSSRAGTIISLTLDRLHHHTTPATLARIEEDLTRTAATADPDFLARVARAGPTPSTPTAPNPPKKPSATPRARSSANPATASTTSKSSPPPTSTNTSSPS